MYHNYYDMPLPEEGELAAEENTAVYPWASGGTAGCVEAWQTGPSVAPLYEDVAPLAGKRDGKGRNGHRGTILFCVAILLIAAGFIALVVGTGLNPTLSLSDWKLGPSSGFDFPMELPPLIDDVQETTIQRSPLEEPLELVLTVIPESGVLTYQEIYAKVLPSVVGIRTRGERVSATGTGVVLTADGYIITNFHVIEGGSTAAVVLQDGTVHDALLVGGDPINDLALLKIEAEGLVPAELGDSALLQVGDEALAIGNPLGEELAGTMTNGIISAINRDMNVYGASMSLIQTTAALNSGNSGGALINIYGQVVGITNMKMSSSHSGATVEGLGFAIPTKVVKEVVAELSAQGHVAGRPTLGITVQTILTAQGEQELSLPPDFDGGILVVKVLPRSDAEKQGVRPGDVIVEANGTPIRENEDLLQVKNALQVGDSVDLKIWREGEYQSISIQLMDQYQLDQIE